MAFCTGYTSYWEMVARGQREDALRQRTPPAPPSVRRPGPAAAGRALRGVLLSFILVASAAVSAATRVNTVADSRSTTAAAVRAAVSEVAARAASNAAAARDATAFSALLAALATRPRCLPWREAHLLAHTRTSAKVSAAVHAHVKHVTVHTQYPLTQRAVLIRFLLPRLRPCRCGGRGGRNHSRACAPQAQRCITRGRQRAKTAHATRRRDSGRRGAGRHRW